MTLISAYVPFRSSPGEAKAKSYDELVTTINGIPEKKLLFILGDQNARVSDDQSPACLVQFRFKEDERKRQTPAGAVLSSQPLFRQQVIQYQARTLEWRHPRPQRWHQLDLILSRRSSLSSIKIRRSFQDADCDTDYSLVCSKVKLPTR